MATFAQYHENVGKHLGTTVNQYNNATKEFSKIDKDVLRISGQGIGVAPPLIDRPQDET